MARLFGTQSHARLMQLRLQLQSTRKEGPTITAYYTKIKEIVDSLSMAGHTVSSDDFIMYLLQCLPFEYDAIVTNINSHHQFLEIEEVLALLLSHEIRVQNAVSNSLPSAHIANRSNRRQGHNRDFGNENPDLTIENLSHMVNIHVVEIDGEGEQ